MRIKSTMVYSFLLSLALAAYLFACRFVNEALSVNRVLATSALVLAVLVGMAFFSKEERPWTPKPGFDWSMHYFRAFAICNIVVTHFLETFGYSSLKNAFFRSSTVYFLIISGFLCQYLQLKKPQPAKEYYKKKLSNVIAPYVIWTFIYFGLAWLDARGHSGLRIACQDFSFKGVLEALMLGSSSNQLWYIPFVSILFLMSPLILKLRNEGLMVATFISAFFYLLIPTRTEISTNLLHTFNIYCHFTVFYLLGFLYARFKQSIDPFLKKYVFVFLALAVILASRILYPERLNIELMPLNQAITLEKLLLSAVMIVVLDKIKSKKIIVFDLFAQFSFTIYFIHYYFISDLLILRNYIVKSLAIVGFTTFIDLGFCVLFLSLLLVVSVLLKKSLGSFSRSVIGS